MPQGQCSERTVVMHDLHYKHDTPDVLWLWMAPSRAGTPLRGLQPIEEPTPVQRSSRKQAAVEGLHGEILVSGQGTAVASVRNFCYV